MDFIRPPIRIYFVIYAAHMLVYGRTHEYMTSALECKKTSKGAEYKGTISATEQGWKCQKWDRQTPHTHKFTEDYLFPDKNVTLANNYCRNPGGKRKKPWCFTESVGVIWQYCKVPSCGCRKSKAGWDYVGKISVTSSGRRCQSWTSQTPHSQSYTDTSAFPDQSIQDASNYCRNPDRRETGGPWCYTTDPEVRWEYCNVPYCECKVTEAGHQYGGRISYTSSGRKCQRWDSQVPHAHKYNDQSCGFPDHSTTDAANFCRNPELNELKGPWCFTTDPQVRWEYCNIPRCEQDEDVHKTPEIRNTSQGINESITGHTLDNPTGSESLVIGLFAASLVLTTLTIGAAVIVVRMYRKLKEAHQKNEVMKYVDDECPENSENARNMAISRRNSKDEGKFNSKNLYYDNCSPDHLSGRPRYSDNPKLAMTSDYIIHSYSSIAGSRITVNNDNKNSSPDGAISRTNDDVRISGSHKTNFIPQYSSW